MKKNKKIDCVTMKWDIQNQIRKEFEGIPEVEASHNTFVQGRLKRKMIECVHNQYTDLNDMTKNVPGTFHFAPALTSIPAPDYLSNSPDHPALAGTARKRNCRIRPSDEMIQHQQRPLCCL